MVGEGLVGSGNQPIHERRFFQVGNAVEARRDPVARGKHVARDLRLHGVHVVHQRRRGNDAAEIHGAGEKQNNYMEVRTLSVACWFIAGTGVV